MCREILFSLFTQSSFIHSIMLTFHSQTELTIFIFLVIDNAVLSHVWKYWKSAHNYVVSDWVKIRWRRWTSLKRIKRSVWMKGGTPDRRNTNVTKNIVMAALVIMNSTLDNAGVLDPLLKFIFKNWDVTHFIILLIIKKLPPITIHFHNFLVLFL